MNHFVLLHPSDDVAVSTKALPKGTQLDINGEKLTLVVDIPAGHKFSLRSLSAGQAVRKYGWVIGRTTCEIVAGSHVHSHNLVHEHQPPERAESVTPPALPLPLTGRNFQGYVRHDGRIGTRNYIAVISTVNCSASVAHTVCQQITPEDLAAFSHVDGVMPVSHEGGCGMSYGGLKHQMLARVLVGLAKHPNVAGCILVGLGCEQGTLGYLSQEHGLVPLRGLDGQLLSRSGRGPAIPVLSIQDEGGFRRTVEKTKGAVRELLVEAEKNRRVTCDARHLSVGLECGGSDGLSGITANPAVGAAADRIVASGGTAILSETSEIYGAEHLLVERSRSTDVANRLLEKIRWWQNYVAMFGVELDNNPSVGNKAGGLTTIAEKSLGAVAKGGSTALEGVFDYAEKVEQRGLVVMDTPGYDPASVTGMMAGGANVIVFTTGRGSCFGSKPAPTIKVATNTAMFERLPEDMDFNAGPIADGLLTVDQAGEQLFEDILRVASGKKTKSELQGIGNYEIVPWTVGPTL